MTVKNIIRLAYSYLRYYNRQTAALFMGIVLASALFSGISGLLASGRAAAVTNARVQYGDWHYCTARGDEDISSNSVEGKGYLTEKTGMLYIYSSTDDTAEVSADEGFLEIMGCDIAEGHYPAAENEVAADEHTLRALGADAELGETVMLNNKSCTVCGIMRSMPSKLTEQQDIGNMVFVSPKDGGENTALQYIKFSEKHSLNKQLKAFCKEHGIQYKDIQRNNGICDLIGAGTPTQVFDIIKTGASSRERGLPYIWGSLNEDGRLAEGMILAGTGIFGMLMIYSLYQVTMRKRIAQFGIMETLGMTDGIKLAVLFAELFAVGIIAYPIGCILGNTAAWAIYRKAGQIFIVHDQRRHTGSGNVFTVSELPDTGRYAPNVSMMLIGALCLLTAFIAISVMLVYKMRKHTISRMMKGSFVKKRSRRICSLKQNKLTGIVVKRFMFPGRAKTIGSMLSLAAGSVMFLGAFYVTECTKRNNVLTFKADDGLGSDIQVSAESDSLSDTLSEDASASAEKISGISGYHPVSYMLGETEFCDGSFKWTEFYAELADDESWQPDPGLMEKYGGRAVRSGDDDYKLKVNIYGYDDDMLRQLDDYLLDGEIDPDAMRRDNSIIFKPLMDGQGNYDCTDTAVGDEITIKTPIVGSPEEAVRFQGEEEWYRTDSFSVTAIAGRPLAKVDSFIGDNGTDIIDIIMTNEQMKRSFGVSGFRTISISLTDSEQAGTISSELYKTFSVSSSCIVKDHTEQIKQQDLYLYQKMFFFYGIAAVIFGVSLIHIMNSMQYFVASKRREFGILRAMGITDSGMMKVLAVQGLKFGMYSSALTAVLGSAAQKVLYYLMVHMYLYIHPAAAVSSGIFLTVLAVNTAVCLIAAVISGRSVLKAKITEEIKD